MLVHVMSSVTDGGRADITEHVNCKVRQSLIHFSHSMCPFVYLGEWSRYIFLVSRFDPSNIMVNDF